MNAERLAAALELDVHDISVCLACLSFVSMASDKGDEREVTRWSRRMAPDLWAEGLELPVRLALARAGAAGVPEAVEGLADVEARGARSPVVHAIVRRLAEQLSARAKGDVTKMGFTLWPEGQPP